jgi:hypothetical protein
MIQIVKSSGGKLSLLHRAYLPDGTKEYFNSTVEYRWGTAYLDAFGKWHLGSKHKTHASAVQSANKQNRSPVWADKPIQIIEIRNFLDKW